MATREIPIESGVPAFSLKTTLDNSPYTFIFIFNQRSQRWSFNLENDAGDILLTGIKFIVNSDLLAQYKYNSEIPQGILFGINLVNNGVPPGVDDLVNVVKLLYEEP